MNEINPFSFPFDFIVEFTSRRIRVSDNLLEIVDVPVVHPPSDPIGGNVTIDAR